MRRIILVSAMVVMALAFGVHRAAQAEMTMIMDGYIVDTKCATANEAELGMFVTTHTKECALMPSCAASGYNLFSEGKLWKFDKASSDKVHEFLKKPDSKTRVSVEMVHGKGNEIKLVSIENAK